MSGMICVKNDLKKMICVKKPGRNAEKSFDGQ